ncbi:hypothetical protein NW762_013393 [Fusarium torreyae]|uniref:Nephrocystin 3-like N-terminal domain-containing protein n=1 Tax=Fusarium torreyae TaxID=1237075 RepID=A0A9W8RKP4_9HYPO|nr:hypothetical protein NW762_013393 [Fusarium torreyae]
MGEEKDDAGLPPTKYTVGWICALRYEMKAARSMLDCEHPTLRLQSEQDGNNYILGRVGKHNIAITSLPQAGSNQAATASKSMQTTFPNIRFCLLVGVGGGVPKSVFSWNDIRLGDIVVSEPTEQGGGVIQYDMGRRERDGFYRLGTLNKPPALLLTAKNTLSTTKNLSKAISRLVNENFGDEEDPEEEWTYPNKARDVLSNTDHPRTTKSSVLLVPFGAVLFASTAFLQFRQRIPGEEWSSLQLSLWISCVLYICFMRITSTWYLKPKEVIRTPRRTTDPKIHYGNIGSGNSVVENAFERDEVAKRDNVICFEMEAAGIMDDFPCLVIRGISNYADSHKNREWQPYAAAVAAAYAKKLLLTISPIGVENMGIMREVPEGQSKNVGIQDIQKHAEELLRTQHSQHDDMVLKWLTPVDHNTKHHDIIRLRQLGTGQWFLDSVEFKDWHTKTENKSLFCSGIPGAGKTIPSAIVIDQLQKEFRDDIDVAIAFIYCDFKQRHEQSVEHLLASLLKQLASRRRGSLSSLCECHKRNMTRPSFEEMLKTLHDVAASYKKVFVMIDALDECQSDGIRSKLLELV